MSLVGHRARRESSRQGERPGGRYRDTLAMWPFGMTCRYPDILMREGGEGTHLEYDILISVTES